MRERTSDMVTNGPSTECYRDCSAGAFACGVLVGLPLVILLVAMVRVLVWPMLS